MSTVRRIEQIYNYSFLFMNSFFFFFCMSSFYDFYCFVYWTSTACTAYSLTGWTSSRCLNKYLGLLWKHGVQKQTLCEACNLAQSLSFPVRIEQGSNRARTWTSLVFLCINSSRFWLLLKTKRFLVKKMPFFLRCNKHISRQNLNVMPDMGGNRKMDRERKDKVILWDWRDCLQELYLRDMLWLGFTTSTLRVCGLFCNLS